MTETRAAPPSHSVMLGLKRGLRRRCPHCGRGSLFAGYLKIEPTCAACGHDNAQYRADDAGPYFTILLVGHLVIGPMLIFPFIWKAPIWLVLGTTLPLILGMTLTLLPFVKGAVVGAQWGQKASRAIRAVAVAEEPGV